MSDNLNFFLPICKVDKQRRLVSGYASTPTKDMDGEIVSLEAVKAALPGFMAWGGPIRQMHQAIPVGKTAEAHVDNKGLWLTAKIVDDNCWKLVEEEVLKAFSIGGKKLSKTGDTITEIDLIETSLVDRPANGDCRFSIAKAAKSLNGDAGYLVKPRSMAVPDLTKPKSDLAKALKGAAKVSEFLEKANQAPQDGKSPFGKDPKDAVPPQGVESGTWPMKCAAHGVENCAKCEKKARKQAAKAEKRDVSTDERQHLAHHGDALPDGSFPIKNESDLSNARQAIGRSKNPGAARALIRRRASELGVKLPDSWSKKEARGLIRKAEEDMSENARAKKLAALPTLASSAEPSFLVLGGTPTKGAGSSSVEGGVKNPENDGDFSSLDFLSLRKGTSAQALSDDLPSGLDFSKDIDMSEYNSNLDEAVLDILKRAAQPTRAQRMGMAQANMKKANVARKECRAGIEEAHKIMKSVYALKLAKKAKKPDDDDGDEMDSSEKVMKALVKAYGALDKVSFYSKAAREQLSKAAGRTGEKEQEAGAPEPGFSVNRNVRDLSQSTLTEGTPPEYPSVSPYPGKAAKYVDKSGKIDANVAELLAENARLEGQAAILGKVRVGSQARPMAFDMSKLNGNGHANVDPLTKAIMDANVNPELLTPETPDGDNHIARVARAQVAGTYLMTPNVGKSIMDPNFHGKAGK